ncbi:MAG: YibE/F family protein [Blastococcus sp.]
MSAHVHSHGGPPAQDRVSVARRRRASRWMLFLLVPVAVATVAGVLVLWPGGGPSAAQRAAAGTIPAGTSYPHGMVTALREDPCGDAAAGQRAQTCATAEVRVVDGPDAGRSVRVDLPADAVASGVHLRTQLVLTRSPGADGAGITYQFQDFARGTPLLVLAVVFALAVGAVARWRGLAALLSMGFAFLVLLTFVLPALLHGESPTWVSLVGSAAIMFVVLYLAHGFSVRTTTALVGTLFGLALVGGLGAVAVNIAHLTGFGSDETESLLQIDPTLNFSGLVIAGVVVAGLGVLNDVTVTQASAVWEMSEAATHLGWRALFARGMAVGRDHIASTVYTIVFAYAGAALPLLLLFQIAGQPFGTVMTGSAVGEELIRILVGGIALVLAVPVTTAVAAVVASPHVGRAVTEPPQAEDDWTDDDWTEEEHTVVRRSRQRLLHTNSGLPPVPPPPSRPRPAYRQD